MCCTPDALHDTPAARLQLLPMPYQPDRHGPHRIVGPGFHAAVFALLRQVPAGRVTTYGDLAAALGSVRVARQVGYAMAAAPDGVPWWRVVSAGGKLSRPSSAAARRQAKALRGEGVVVRGGVVLGFELVRALVSSDQATRRVQR